jgi:hypothetical protein
LVATEHNHNNAFELLKFKQNKKQYHGREEVKIERETAAEIKAKIVSISV